MHLYLSHPIARFGLAVLAVLVAASLAVATLRRAYPRKNFTELSARVNS